MINQEHQELLLRKSINSLNNDPIQKRDHSSIMMATSKKKVQEVKLIIRDFRRKLCEFLEDTDEFDTVYQLQVSLFPMTKGDL